MEDVGSRPFDFVQVLQRHEGAACVEVELSQSSIQVRSDGLLALVDEWREERRER